MYEGKRILVTGGAGFLGSNLVLSLVPVAERIWVLDDLFTGTREFVPLVSNVEFIHGSITDSTLLRKILPKVDYVFHFAVRNIVLSEMQPESDFLINAGGTVRLFLNTLTYSNIRRIVYASTSSIYGNSSNLPTTENEYDISVPYSASKMTGELFAAAYFKSYALPVTCLRYSNVYGPRQSPENPYCGVVAKFMAALSENEPLTIYGDGTQTRDFTYVEDAISATLTAGLAEGTLGGIFNVGTGVETNINTLAEMVTKVIGRKSRSLQYRPKRAIDTVYRRAVDTDKLKAQTGWRPKYPLQAGLIKTWEWFGSDKIGGKNP